MPEEIEPLKCECLTPIQKLDLKRAVGLLVSAVKFKRSGYQYKEGIDDIIDDLRHEADIEIKRFRELHNKISDIPICPHEPLQEFEKRQHEPNPLYDFLQDFKKTGKLPNILSEPLK